MLKRKMITIVTALTIITMTALPASAGSRQRHTWEGAAIGLGAAIIGSALITGSMQPRWTTEDRDSDRGRGWSHHHRHYDRDDSYDHRYRSHHGHWEIRSVWVPPIVEKQWREGHHRHHRWTPGQWVFVEIEPGYYREEKVWVASY